MNVKADTQDEEIEDDLDLGTEGGDEVVEGEENEEGTEGGESSEEEISEEGQAAGAAEQALTRGESRQAKLARERNDLRLENARLAGELEGRKSAPATQVDNGVAARERQAKLESMTPEDRREFLRDEELGNMKNAVLLTQLQTQDALDRNSYQAVSRSGSREATVYAKYADEVERRLKAERNNGRNWPRETILAQIIGEQALKGATIKPKVRQSAAARVDITNSRPMSTRSNAGVVRKKSNESLEELESRISNVVF